MKYLQKKYALSDSGASDLLKGIIYSVLMNISLMLPVILLALVLDAMLPYVIGQEYANIPAWGFILFGVMALAVIFIIHYVQYSCTYIGTYKESARRRISIAEHLRKLPLSFFGDRDIAELTGTIMGDCAGFEHAFSHTVSSVLWGCDFNGVGMRWYVDIKCEVGTCAFMGCPVCIFDRYFIKKTATETWHEVYYSKK